jgi:hypothetical protein
MSFVCGMCHNLTGFNNLAFTYEYDNDGELETEGVCGDCAEDSQ